MIPLTAKDVATALGVHERTAIRLFRSGEIRAMRVGRLWRTSQKVLADYIKVRLYDVEPGTAAMREAFLEREKVPKSHKT